MQLHQSLYNSVLSRPTQLKIVPTRTIQKSSTQLGKSQKRTLVQPIAVSSDQHKFQGAQNRNPEQNLQDKEGYDVYVYQPVPLEEGEEKHTISVFVADESGLINRVAGVFARRGVNIESLAVGLNIDTALFTIVVNGTPQTVSNLVKQLTKLVKVRYVEDITDSDRMNRELLLLKLRAPAGPARTEVLQIAEIFRAQVVDVSERCLTVCCSGDPGKNLAFMRVMRKFGIVESARTGRITLKRGEELLEMGGWGDGLEQKIRLRELMNEAAPQMDGGEQSVDGDVYMVDNKQETERFWKARNVITASYEDAQADSQGFTPHTLSIDVKDNPGVLNTVTGVIARRGYNLQSLAVGPSEIIGRSRIITVVPTDRRGCQKLIKQIEKLVIVDSIKDLTQVPTISRELMLIKVRCGPSQRQDIYTISQIFKADICDISPTTITLELQGQNDRMVRLQKVIEQYGILEIARTGRIALTRDSGIDSQVLEQSYLTQLSLGY
eukprot:TRINITY_DN2801_c0_g1_i10.p1 TRINITY_DN2801_c0_g1~~TRINITY_DN2801_c0_g1_i10.p1  ORF type:complete len:535 (-),score=52.95 TRINITY_DN2801_c0_g1_i10:381-1862(-)